MDLPLGIVKIIQVRCNTHDAIIGLIQDGSVVPFLEMTVKSASFAPCLDWLDVREHNKKTDDATTSTFRPHFGNLGKRSRQNSGDGIKVFVMKCNNGSQDFTEPIEIKMDDKGNVKFSTLVRVKEKLAVVALLHNGEVVLTKVSFNMFHDVETYWFPAGSFAVCYCAGRGLLPDKRHGGRLYFSNGNPIVEHPEHLIHVRFEKSFIGTADRALFVLASNCNKVWFVHEGMVGTMYTVGAVDSTGATENMFQYLADASKNQGNDESPDTMSAADAKD